MGGKDREAGELEEEGVLVPQGGPPGGAKDGQAEIHAQHDAEKELGTLQPARNPLRRRLIVRR